LNGFQLVRNGTQARTDNMKLMTRVGERPRTFAMCYKFTERNKFREESDPDEPTDSSSFEFCLPFRMFVIN
jgi:hypothetical protein